MGYHNAKLFKAYQNSDSVIFGIIGLLNMKVDFHLKLFSFDRKITVDQKLVQYCIICVVVLISTVAAYWGTAKILALLVGVMVGTAGFLTLLRFPNLGYILLFLGGMFIPFKGPGGFNVSILLVMLMTVLWLMDMFVVKHRFDFVKSSVIRPAVYMLIVSVLAFAVGQIRWFVFANQAPFATQLGGFAIYFFLVLAMVMTGHMLRDIKWQKAIVWIFIALGAFYMLGRTLNLSYSDRFYQHGVVANSMFRMWLVALPLSQAIFNKHLKPFARGLLYGVVILTFYVSYFQDGDWKSGWVPAAIVAAVLVGLRLRKFSSFLIPLALIVIPLAIMVVAYLANDLISTDEYSWGTRLDAWIVVLNISRVSPVIGMGFANYYWYAQVFTIRGYHLSFNSHSQYVDLIAQTGILGLVCFIWILFEITRQAWKLLNQLPDGFEKAYAHGIFASVFGVLMAAFLVDWVLPFAYNIGLDGVRASILPWIFFGGLISIEQLHRANQNAKPVNLEKSY